MRKKVLVVDDDPGICNSLTIVLRGEGYCVDKTQDSREAALLIKKDKYDLCIFDYKMDGLNGIDLLKIAKKVNPRCQVFVISGVLDVDKLRKDARLADDVVSKPFDVEALLQKIAAIV